jgi:subtilisin family serine protease
MSVIRRFSTLILAAVLAGSAVGAAPPADRPWVGKLDPFLRRVALGLHAPSAHPRDLVESLPSFVRARRDAADPVLYVKGRLDGLSPERLSALGVEVRGRAGEIVSLAIPATALEAVASLREVRWLKVGRSYELNTSVSTSSAFVASRDVNSGLGNIGQGVIVGIVDTGIAWNNADFRRPDGTTRVLAIWDQTLTDASYPPPAGFSFGSYYTGAQINAALQGGPQLPTNDGYGHGTHVAGIAAGNGRAIGNGSLPSGTYAGVAPDADLLIVRVFDNSGIFCNACDLTAAVQFIDQFAAAAGKPWVGNMSLGDDTGGAHDGTSPDELAIDALVGPGHPGKQMAVAAGNSGARHIHWEGTQAAGTTRTNTFQAATPVLPTPGNDFTFLDLWYEGADRSTLEMVMPGGQVVSAAYGTASGDLCLTAGGTINIDATNAPDPQNGLNEVVVLITDPASCPIVEPPGGTWTIRLVSQTVGSSTGAFDMWTAWSGRLGSGVSQFLSTFSLNKTVSVPGTSRNAITAGAYTSKVSWINSVGSTTNTAGVVGTAPSFSGSGPTRDGRIKPDISAPGLNVGSSRPTEFVPGFDPTFWERDGAHYNMGGTSMATPHVAGTVALLFAANPALDGAEARAVLQRSAVVDAQTGAVPNTRFGWGKLRALEAAYESAALATNLAATSDTNFAWTGAGTNTSWNVYRGTIPGLSATNYGACFLSGLLTPAFSDSEVPPAGTSFVYHAAGVYLHPTTHLPVEGSLGTDSAGRVRPNNFPCP